MRKSAYSALTVATLILPALASAASVYDLLALFNNVLNAAIAILITAAVVAVFYGVVKAIFSAAGEAKKEGWKIALQGVFAVFIMVSIWGIIRLLQNTFSVTSTSPVIPQGVQINTGL
ncbi:hypothetical protein HZC00_00900 [Candidatus Kaiserbacteria bacterium]|nr:hypothetical protein [Candidatus Kaiserbacteria bacterium]